MPRPGETITGRDGQLRVWVPDSTNSRNWEYLQQASGFQSAEEALQADLATGQGSYMPASFVDHMPFLMKAFITTGLIAAGVTGVGALAAPGLFGAGATGAAAGTGTAAAAGTVGGALPTVPLSTTLAGLPSVSLAGGVPAAAIGTGAALPALPISTGSITAGLPSVSLGTAPAAVAPAAPAILRGTTAGKLYNAGQILSGYAQGAAQGRQAEANLNLNTDALRQRQAESLRQDALDRAKLEMDQRTRGQDLESQARRQAVWAAFAKAGPARITPPPNLAPFTMTRTGGMPSQEDLTTLGAQGYDAAIKRLLSGSDKQFTTPPTIPTPPLTPQPNESWLDKLARWGGTGMSLAGAYKGYIPPPTTGRS